MTTQGKYENEGQGDASPPETPVTPGASAQFDVAAVVEAIAKDPSLMGRLSQAAADRTRAKIEPQLSGFREELARLQALTSAGLPEPVALDFLDLQRQVSQSQSQSGPPQPGAAAQPPTTPSFDAEGVFKALGGDPTEPGFVALHRSGPVTAEKLLEYMAARQPKAEPNLAQQMPTPGRGGAATTDLDNQYLAAVSKIRKGDVDAQWKLILQFRERAAKEGIEFSY